MTPLNGESKRTITKDRGTERKKNIALNELKDNESDFSSNFDITL